MTGDILIIADGAACGCAIQAMLEKSAMYRNYSIYLPESFEWLLLKSDIIKDAQLYSILANPADYIESSEYFSWERFFTALLEKLTKNSDYVPSYDKTGKVPAVFKHSGNMQKVLNCLPSFVQLGKV
ncbi:MAG: hypothetical protein NC489_45570 [Ruminococcus flavefaciens]|nr:hypothetical protein [Ruminococcus flavefaciens]